MNVFETAPRATARKGIALTRGAATSEEAARFRVLAERLRALQTRFEARGPRGQRVRARQG